MKTPPHYPQEEKRLAALRAKKIDKQPSASFVALTEKAARALNAPISTIAAIEKDKEVYLGSCGLDAKTGPRDISFCGHALVSEEMLICKDTTKDERFNDNPYVIGPPFVRFYAGMKLIDWESGEPIAVFCIKDTVPRVFTPLELATFVEFAEEAEKLINNQETIR